MLYPVFDDLLWLLEPNIVVLRNIVGTHLVRWQWFLALQRNKNILPKTRSTVSVASTPQQLSVSNACNDFYPDHSKKLPPTKDLCISTWHVYLMHHSDSDRCIEMADFTTYKTIYDILHVQNGRKSRRKRRCYLQRQKNPIMKLWWLSPLQKGYYSLKRREQY